MNNTSTMTNQESVLRIINSTFGPKPCEKPRHDGMVGIVNSHKDGTWILCYLPFLLCLMLFISTPALATVIKAMPDRDPVRMNESFSVVFSSEESVDGDPDFSPLAEDFEILGQNQGSQISIVNGKMSNKQEWTLTLSPKRTGAIPIPAIAFGSDSSQPGRVSVIDSSAAKPSTAGGTSNDEEIKLEVEAVPKNPYVQAQVIYTVRVLLRANLVGADLSEPVAQDALIERLSDDHRYSTTRNGRDYTAIERSFAVFPQKSGLLSLEPMRLTAQVEIPGRSFFARSTRAMQVKSEGIDLQVRPIPAAFTGKHWLPTTDLKLEESWPQNPPHAKAGEPITRTLSLSAMGVTKGLLPEIGAELQLDPSIKQYPDQPALTEEKLPSTGISSTRQEKTALIPSKPGKFKMPAIEIPWWNIKTDRMEIARIAELTLNVQPSSEASSQATPSNPALPSSPESLPVQVIEKNAGQVQNLENAWFWMALFLGAGWLTTGLAWWWKSRHIPVSGSSRPKSEPSADLGLARKALRSACTKHDPAAARTALLHWAGLYWPERKPATLAEIASLGGDQLAVEIGHINHVLYSHAAETWNGDALWVAVQTLHEGKLKRSKESLDLEPMYR